ncbi:tRNA 2-thiocytidine(32) synthetase TtcA [Cupriavidus gilardii]|uniref:tRNA 2-thiocytidine(32) synthetase TtcA n=1 Tax=Cupriavidus gilardii TaxID=82541 RepID=UPI00157313E4|nr:tRNA 2-thiocytidine(32) synthetase TtcA [Cupriavidus gilardii]MCG5259511.1 tRNA 2-thiocytidine(32) synthetase TtcA [Cupriavidus gilardii]MDF9429591.1 tRNA 2-thiocytidine(32) synthetase TtcA [Cupriavidus gilardii]NSX05405.1 tRNA 2-thiocytidine(32) synthetase TtcA [Cupriavidus gilardii]
MTETTHSRNFYRLETYLQSQTGRAIGDFKMIEDGDTVLVCLSGGKDSYTMLSVLMALQKRAPIDFKLIAMNLDQKQPGFPEDVLPRYLDGIGVQYVIVEADTYSIVKEKVPEGKTTCSLCSRLRRGVIYRTAKELGANKIALGHHRDDIVQTFFLNMFFGGKMKAMPPKLATDDGQHIVIRPLAYCSEKDIAAYARAMAFPIIPCNLCGSQENLQRKKVKEMLLEWERQNPGRIDNIFSALKNVVPSHLADTELFDFNGLATGLAKVDEASLFGDSTFSQQPLVFAGGSAENRMEFVRFEKPSAREARPERAAEAGAAAAAASAAE